MINNCWVCVVFGHKNASYHWSNEKGDYQGFLCERCYAQSENKAS